MPMNGPHSTMMSLLNVAHCYAYKEMWVLGQRSIWIGWRRPMFFLQHLNLGIGMLRIQAQLVRFH
jgi:hypothetical protein